MGAGSLNLRQQTMPITVRLSIMQQSAILISFFSGHFMRLLAVAFLLVSLMSCSDRQLPSKTDQPSYSLAKRAQELQASADKGDAASQEVLGWMYLNGMGVPSDDRKAAALFRQAAERGSARARRHMGHLTMYGGGGIDRDPNAAAAWFKKAIAGGEGWAYIGLIDARRRAEGNLPLGESLDLLDKAEEKLTPLTDARSGIALYTIAKRRALDRVEKDSAMARALESLTKAAESGDADAQRTLGEVYKRGDGVNKDIEAAVAWYEKGAAQGDSPSQFALGEIYLEEHILVSRNVERARHWLEQAAALNHVHAQFALGRIYDEGIGAPKQSAMAAKWYERAASQRNSAAQNNLGVMYSTGEGVPKDPVLAYAWFNLAAADGHAVARENRDGTELNAADREIAQRLSAAWKVGQVLKR